MIDYGFGSFRKCSRIARLASGLLRFVRWVEEANVFAESLSEEIQRRLVGSLTAFKRVGSL